MNYKYHLEKLDIPTMCKIIVRLYDHYNETSLMHEIADVIKPHFDDIVHKALMDIAESKHTIEESLEILDALEWLSEYCYPESNADEL